MADESKAYEGFIDLGVGNVDDVHEAETQPTGAYDLIITQAKAIPAQKEDGSGTYLKKIQVMIEFKGIKNAAVIFHNMTLPQPSDEPKRRDYLIVLMKKFYKLFGVKFSGSINTTDLVGAQATGAFVDLTSYQKTDASGNPVGEPMISNQLNLKGIKV